MFNFRRLFKKESVTNNEIYDFKVSFSVIFSRAPDNSLNALTNIFQKFSQIFAIKDAPPPVVTYFLRYTMMAVQVTIDSDSSIVFDSYTLK
jgi:hypothetical protein